MVEPATESSEALIQYLEQATGKKLRTREDVRRFLDEIAARKPDESPAERFWRTAKEGTWLLLLVAAFLQYYFMDILIQVNSMPEIRVNLPATAPQSKPASRI